MNFDLLDESYPMVKSILHFEQVDQTGLTGLKKWSDRFSTSRANFGRQHTHACRGCRSASARPNRWQGPAPRGP